MFLDLSDAKPAQSFEPIPAGAYIAKVDNVEVKDTRAGDGKYLNIRYRITGGEFKNRVLFEIINTHNKSEKAQEIGRSRLADLMHKLGMGKVLESVKDLEGKGIAIKVGIGKDQNGNAINVVKEYLVLDATSIEHDLASDTFPSPF